MDCYNCTVPNRGSLERQKEREILPVVRISNLIVYFVGTERWSSLIYSLMVSLDDDGLEMNRTGRLLSRGSGQKV